MPLDGCFIGACMTTEEDLVLAALVLEVGLQQGLQLQLAPGKRMVVPRSLPIVSNLRALGLLDFFEQAGFEQPAVSCSLCLGMGADRAGHGETWLSSQNRNFKNHMGHGSIGHICSAAVVAASSFGMRIIAPRPLLNQISPQRYQTLLDKCRNWKVAEGAASRYPAKIANQRQRHASPMPAYVEPYRSFQKPPRLSGPRTEGPVEKKTTSAWHHETITSLGVKCVIAKSFSFIYGRNQPTIGLLGITLTDERFYAAATTGAAIEMNPAARLVTIAGLSFPFIMDDIELALIQQRGLTPAYKTFGKAVFRSLCAGVPGRGGYEMDEDEEILGGERGACLVMDRAGCWWR
ncbi:hypothetical protein BJX70DRAFT_350118 [Aspergillus crustosus]